MGQSLRTHRAQFRRGLRRSQSQEGQTGQQQHQSGDVKARSDDGDRHRSRQQVAGELALPAGTGDAAASMWGGEARNLRISARTIRA